MIIGSHNTMSYLEPVWYLRWARKFAKCQKLSLIKQIQYGVKAFDLRVRFDENREPYFAHGLMRYKNDCMGNPYSVIESLNAISTNDNPIYIRIVLETFFDADDFQVDSFLDFIGNIETRCDNVYLSVYIKTPWNEVYNWFHERYIEVFHGNNTLKDFIKTPEGFIEWQDEKIEDMICKGYDGIMYMDFV